MVKFKTPNVNVSNKNKNPKASSLLTYDFTLVPASRKTKTISAIAVLSFLIALIGGSYIPSLIDGKIGPDRFTVSRALQYGNHYVTVLFFTISFLLTMYLNYLRDKSYLFNLRIFFLFVEVALLITIVWVTVDLNLNLHYIFATVIFFANLIYLFIIYHIFNEYLKGEKEYKRHLLDAMLLITVITFIVLLVFAKENSEKNATDRDHEVFASFENIMLFFTIFPILYLGFI